MKMRKVQNMLSVGFAALSLLAVMTPALALCGCAEKPLALVEGGRLQMRVACGGTPAELLASNEYYRIVRKVTGCTTDAAAQAAAPKRIQIRIAGDPEANDTVRIFRDEKGVVLEGNNARAASGAMYRFLEELGCRWYWADKDGEYLPAETPNLVLKGKLDIRETAAFKYRQLSTHPVHGKYAFLAHNRANMLMGKTRGFIDWGGSGHWGGHSFGAFVPSGKGYRNYEDHFKDEPECFALRNGKRVKDQHCYTSPRTREIFLKFMDDFWTKRGKEDLVMNLSALDTPVYCQCPTCAAKGDSSTLYFSFLNDLITETEKRHPGHLYDSYAYSFYLDPPKCKVHPNLMVTYCQYNRCYKHALGDTNCLTNVKSLKAVKGWWEKLDHMPDIYGYHYDAFDWPKPLLLPIWDVLQDEIRWCKKGGIRFYKTEFYGSDCAKAKVQRFSSYAALRLFWNPDLDMDALMTEYTDRVFGKAGAEMKAYWKLLAKAWSTSGKCIGGYGNKPGPFASDLMTKEVKDEARRLFRAAEAKLARGSREWNELKAEYGYFKDWTDITRSRDEWTAIADKSDPKRVAALKAAEPAETLYPQAGKKGRPTAIDWEPEAVLDKDGKFQGYKNTSDGLLYGNHPGVFADEFWLPCQWVNYQLDFDFRYPKNPRKNGYRMGTLMRWHGERFAGHPFSSINFRIDKSGNWATWVYERFDRKQGPVDTKLGQGKVAPLDDGWHHFSGRVVDSAYIVKVDGKTLYETDDAAPVGRGMINVCTGTHPPCPLAITNLTVRAIHAPGDPFETEEKRKGKARVDGSGRTIYE